MFEELFRKRPVRPRGERFEYACSNFVYLGLIVERLTGLDLDAAAKRMLWGPLGMARTTWNTVVGDLWVRFTGRVRGLLDSLGCRALVRGPENRGVALPLEHRLLEKPFAVTEFDYCFPNPARGGGALAAGALASLQEAGALWRFCWSHFRTAAPRGSGSNCSF